MNGVLIKWISKIDYLITCNLVFLFITMGDGANFLSELSKEVRRLHPASF